MKAKLRLLVLVALVAATVLTAVPGAKADTVTTLTGTLPDGATWKAEVPPNWNGTLLLYSHGYVFPGRPNPALDVGNPATGTFLLDHGFALAGSSYANTGWALQEGIGDQLGVLDEFRAQVGRPTTTIAWGHSLGGIMTAGLVQAAPERFDGALPMCGVLAGGVGTWNQALDGLFAFKVLLGGGAPLDIVRITDPVTNAQRASQILATAQSTPQGRARLGLVAALGDSPGWTDPTKPEPAPDDFATRLANQIGSIGGARRRQPLLEHRRGLRAPALAFHRPRGGPGALRRGRSRPARRPADPEPGAADQRRPGRRPVPQRPRLLQR